MQLGFASSLHYLDEHVLVWLEKPIGQTCAIRIANANHTVPPLGTLELLSCDGSVFETRTVQKTQLQ